MDRVEAAARFPMLSQKARERLAETAEAEEACGDADVADALRFILEREPRIAALTAPPPSDDARERAEEILARHFGVVSPDWSLPHAIAAEITAAEQRGMRRAVDLLQSRADGFKNAMQFELAGVYQTGAEAIRKALAEANKC
jgi:hypothetical protein